MNKSIAVVFPGQGSQSLGMLEEFYSQFPVVSDTFEQASQVLGYDLWGICKNGPAEKLNQTVYTQPAMLVAAIACWRVLLEKCPVNPKFFAGHSLGEYSALVASGQIEFKDAVLLAKKRATLMQNAVATDAGAMAAILGLSDDIINEVCQSVSDDRYKVWPANYNSPGQVVIAGHAQAVQLACGALKEKGAKRAITLPVSVPSHCPLMQSAADQMLEILTDVNWSPATVGVVHNADVLIHDDKESLVQVLSKQLIEPVRWVETIEYFSSQQVDLILEVGPGKVLSGLSKRICKDISSKSIFDIKTLEDFISSGAQS